MSNLKPKHGLSNTKIYKMWTMIKQRCNNKKCRAYINYGGRGIKIADCWLNDVASFNDYVNNLPNSNVINYTLDRIDNDCNYEPGNLRWTTRNVQGINRRINKTTKTGYKGVSLNTSKQLYKSYIKINKKLKHLGYFNSIEDALNARNKYIVDNNLTDFKIQIFSNSL